MESIREQLTAQFYQWELLGRGWIRSEEEIELEPPFTPFFGHFLWKEPKYKDDGFRHTLLSKLASLFKVNKQKQVSYTLPDVSYSGFLFEENEELISFQLSFPKGTQFSSAATEQFFSMLSYCTKPVSFELVGEPEKITIQITSREGDSAYLQMQLQTFFPLLKIVGTKDALAVYDERSFATIDFGLEQEFIRPIQTQHSLDSLTSVFAFLEHVRQGQKIIYQVLFNGLINKWEGSMMRAVSDSQGSSFFEDAPEMVSLAKTKTAKQLMAVSVRVLAFAPILYEAMAIVEQLSFAIHKTFASSSNALIPLGDNGYGAYERLNDVYKRTTHRLGMLLNVEELTALAHFPSPSLHSKKLLAISRKTKLPTFTMQSGIVLGRSEEHGERVEITLSPEQRLKHTHIIGATGTGKSTLLLSLIVQDVGMGNGIAVLDPHGDLIEAILQYIPEKRINDVMLIDPSDSEYPVGFNILHAHSEIEKETLCSDLVAAFKRLSTSWGDQMHSVLSNAILAFLESSKGGTLIDLRRFLIEPSYRTSFLETIEDYNIHYYWQKQYPLLKSASIGPILTRLDNFLRSRLIRNMVAQKKGIDFEGMMNKGKIILVKLSQGLIGEENSYLLGSFIVSKLHQAALARQGNIERKDFFFYIDEFQHFMTPSMASILSGARKYHLGLILAHQDMQQLAREGNELSSAVLSNASTRICFRLSEQDAKKLSEGFSSFEPSDFQNLNRGEAIARIEKPEQDFSLTIEPALSLDQYAKGKGQIIALSRERYASRKDKVEEELFTNIDLKKNREVQPKEAIAKVEEVAKRVSSEPPALEPKHIRKVSEETKQEITEKIIRRKEESQHRYLQNLVKRLAETKGYKATIEAPLPSKDGKVDVLLEMDSISIACEISVTTAAEWELYNVRKCLDAGYGTVICCMQDQKSVASFKRKVEDSFDKKEQGKIKVLDPESMILYLDTLGYIEKERETTFKGYRVKVTHMDMTTEEQKYKKDAVARVIGQSMQKRKK